MKKQKIILTPEQKEFQKVKRFVQKRFPGARTIKQSVGSYVVVDGKGLSVLDPEMLLPPVYSVREAWYQAKYNHWYSNMIRKSNNAFSDEKIYKKLAKERGSED